MPSMSLGIKVLNERLKRWSVCSLCEQDYHGVVKCALGWACWKTYLGRPEENQVRRRAMSELGSGLSQAEHLEDALSVGEAELSLMRRIGAQEAAILAVQSNVAITYEALGRLEQSLEIKREVYSGYLRLNEEHENTLISANNYASSLISLKCFEEAKSLLRETLPATRRVLGEVDITTLRIRRVYAIALYKDNDATLDDLREAVNTLDDTARIARRVLGDSHPTTAGVEVSLRNARAVLCTREAPSSVP